MKNNKIIVIISIIAAVAAIILAGVVIFCVINNNKKNQLYKDADLGSVKITNVKIDYENSVFIGLGVVENKLLKRDIIL